MIQKNPFKKNVAKHLKRQAYKLTAAFIACASLSSINAHADWEVAKEDHNIKLYRSVHDEHKFTSIIEASVSAPLETIIEVLEDPNACNQWLFRCQTARHINPSDSQHLYTYYVRDYPYPLKDRHGVIEISKSYSDESHFKLTFKLMPSMTPEDNTLIIPDAFDAVVLLTRKDNKTHIKLEHNLKPGGNIPSWLKQSIHEEFPFQSIQGLIQSAQKRQLSKKASLPQHELAAIELY